MENYKSYMDKQTPAPALHEKLLALDVRKTSRPWFRYGAFAACAALILGVGLWKSAPRPNTVLDPASSAGPFAADYVSLPGETDALGSDEVFTINNPVDGGKLAFPYIPAIFYQDATNAPEVAASRAFAPGSFLETLTKADIQAIFWGQEGKPEAESPKAEQGDLPWMLFWDGYTVHGSAWYDSEGQVTELTILGEKGRSSFELELRVGALPFSCTVDLNRGDEISQFNGVSVAGWSKIYDQDGDGRTDYICGSEFMTPEDIGVRFVNRNSEFQAEYGGGEDMGLGGAQTFNALFVRQALTGGLYLDHLNAAGRVPAWREEEYSSLAQARQEEAFAPYLPEAELSGYDEFYGRLSYQEGRDNTLFVRWSRGYDNVEVDVCRDGVRSYHLADPARPETYDLRLYSIPWSETVPEQYWETVNAPAFRAEDMTLSLVEARGRVHDTGGMTYSFDVLHPDGTLVSYRCDGMTAQQVWELVEPTL